MGAEVTAAPRGGSARLAVCLVLAAARAELRQLEAVGVVATVLLRDVVALLALHARESDLGADIRRLASHVPSTFRALRRHSSMSVRRRLATDLHCGSGGGTRTRDTTIMSRVL